MGSKQVFQPLTREDTITVTLYRAGIVISTISVAGAAFIAWTAHSVAGAPVRAGADPLAWTLQASVGMSVFFIHLYIGRFKRFLINLYLVSLGCLAVLLYLGGGSVSAALVHTAYSPLLLLPLSGCLGFVTAKEAFCFRLVEGYLLALIMPLYLLLVSGGVLPYAGISAGLAFIAALLVLFTLRKVFMPIAYDIGDKTAYR